MIRTVTLNTGFDEVFTVNCLTFGGVADVLARRVFPSGKGINAARVVAALGTPVVAYALVGADDHDTFAAHLAGEGVECRLAPVPGGTRRNLTLLVDDGQPAAHFRGRGFELVDEAPVRSLLGILLGDIRPGDIVSLHGATPSGLPTTTWASFAAAASSRGARVMADIYGAPLVELVERCALLACKPNEEEAQVLPVPVQHSPGAALRYLASRGVQFPTISLGARGLAFLRDDALWVARCPVSDARMLVGAGDACTAGLAVALWEGAEGADAARRGVAAAGAHVEGRSASDLGARARELMATVTLERMAPSAGAPPTA